MLICYTLNYQETSKKNCQTHSTNLLVKQPKTAMPSIRAMYPMNLNCQAYLKKLLRRFSLPKLHATYPMNLNCQTCEYVIKKILLTLDTTDPVGMDQILAKFLKDGAEELAVPLTNTINLSNYHPSQRSVKLLS